MADGYEYATPVVRCRLPGCEWDSRGRSFGAGSPACTPRREYECIRTRGCLLGEFLRKL